MYRGTYIILALGVWLLVFGTLPSRRALAGNALWLRIAGSLLLVGVVFRFVGGALVPSGNFGIGIGIFFGFGLIAIVVALIKGG